MSCWVISFYIIGIFNTCVENNCNVHLFMYFHSFHAFSYIFMHLHTFSCIFIHINVFSIPWGVGSFNYLYKRVWGAFEWGHYVHIREPTGILELRGLTLIVLIIRFITELNDFYCEDTSRSSAELRGVKESHNGWDKNDGKWETCRSIIRSWKENMKKKENCWIFSLTKY